MRVYGPWAKTRFEFTESAYRRFENRTRNTLASRREDDDVIVIPGLTLCVGRDLRVYCKAWEK